MLIIAQYVARHELDPLSQVVTVKDLIIGAQKVIAGLGVTLKSPIKGNSVRFFKVRIGKKGIGRMAVFMTTEHGKVVPVLIRRKKDKIFGTNMAMNNKGVVDQIRVTMVRILTDIEAGSFEEFE